MKILNKLNEITVLWGILFKKIFTTWNMCFFKKT